MKRAELILIGMFAVCLMCGNALGSEKGYTIITADRVKSSAKMLEQGIQRVIGNIEPREIDYNSPEAKALIEKLGIKMVPYVIFDKDIVENDKFIDLAGQKMIARNNGEYVIPDAMLIPVGAMLFQREHNPGQLDIFVMSQCSYGNSALAQIANYLEKNPGAVNVTCHYITTFREFGIDSLHGPEEIKEDINQLLIQDKDPVKFWEYIKEHQAGKSFENACLAQGINPGELTSLKDKGISLLEKDSNLCKELGIQASPTFLWENQILTNSIDMLRQLLPETNAVIPTSEVKVVVFHSPTCPQCRWLLDEYIPNLEKEFGNRIGFEYYDTTIQANFEKKLAMEKEYSVLGSVIPEVFIGQKALVSRAEIENKLKKIIEEELGIEIASAASGGLAMTEGARPDMSRAESREGPKQSQDILLTTFQSFAPLAVISAGLLDGINPCAFSTIVFFLSFLVLAGYNRRRIILVGAVFTLAVFLTYLGLGLGAFRGLQGLRAFSIFSKYFDVVVGGLTIILGAVSLYDYIRFKRTGQAKDMILKLPGAIKNTIHQSIGGLRGAGRAALIKVLLIAFGVGVMVSLLESVCTGQIYLPTITFILKMKVMWWKALRYLILYNVMFTLPLIIVLVLTLYGIRSDWWQRQVQNNLGKVKLITALLFFSLGIFILLWR